MHSFDTCVITRWLNAWVFFHKIELSIQSFPATNAKMPLHSVVSSEIFLVWIWVGGVVGVWDHCRSGNCSWSIVSTRRITILKGLWVWQVRRFVRYNLGEGIAKKSVDFAAEVAAQTAAKADVKPAADTPKVEEVKQEDTTPKVSVYLHNRNTVVNSLSYSLLDSLTWSVGIDKKFCADDQHKIL